MAKSIIFCVALVCLSQSCKPKTSEQTNLQPLAKVGARYLYQKDILGLGIGKGMTSEDSLNQLKMHVNNWVRDELMLQVALDNIEISEDVEQMVRDYKATLVMNQYEEVLISQRLNTEVTPQQLAEYYSNHQEQYIAGLSWVRCHFVKVKRMVDDIKKLKQWFKSAEGVDFEKVKLFCAQNNTVHILNEDLWIEYDKLVAALPDNAISSRHRERQSVLDRMDDEYQYLLQIFEYRDKDDTTPLSQVQEEIRRIIIHQRRNKILQDIRKEVFEQAKKQGAFDVY